MSLHTLNWQAPISHTTISSNRVAAMVASDVADLLTQLLSVAERGLASMHRGGRFAHTVRRAASAPQSIAVPRMEGESLRYSAIVSIGLSDATLATQLRVLDGLTASDLSQLVAARAELSDDAGAIALAAWASAKAANVYAGSLMRRLDALLKSASPIDTVDCSWILCAALSARHLADTTDVIGRCRALLLTEQSQSGIFPHRLPSRSNDRMREHVGCFADQVYPIQALSRLAVANSDEEALAAAERCSARICALQGPAGQWWWHYDTRDGSVVEGYPVYSVHQHAMGPMALLDLLDAGGTDHRASIARGVQWLEQRPETREKLIDTDLNVIWRKVARREPAKATRTLSALTTGLKQGFHLPGLDLVFPPAVIDYECRPYEFGWMLHAWLSHDLAAQ